ncbi:hypothetical protein ACRDNQ_10480 [Palleronia sp. KMU-117]|uniref:hypothetical protein n=1 Tax=Palleronia sp. KMU-117 TaxID=3434108 RepID=UPI003D7083A6
MTPSTQPTEDSIAGALAPHFDVAFYVRQFETSPIPEDPLRHYVETGWKEGLDPHPNFSTQHYLSMNADVRERGLNPYWHYVVAGRAERRLPRAVGGMRVERLRNLRSLEAIKASWTRKDAYPEALSVDDLSGDARVLAALRADQVLLSICHDHFRQVAGGIQLCVRLEERKMLDHGMGHLAIHPWQPLPTLADRESDGLMVLHAQGEEIGPVRLDDLGKVIAARTPPQYPISVAVHSLLGHEPEALSAFLEGFAPQQVLFWLHDHFTLCESFTLQRNTVAYCGAPDPASPACGICIYGETRATHLDRMAGFFSAMRPLAVAPSSFQLDFWRSRADLPRTGEIVHPLATLEPTTDQPPPPPDDSPRLRIAFLGWPADHKGWDTFCELAQKGRSSGVEFHYFGSADIVQRGIVAHHVEVSPERPDAATLAMWTSAIDIVVHWAGWPETFSFTTHEALAADALVVTSAVSGNVANLAGQDPRVFVLPDTEALIREVLSGEIAALADARRAKRKLSGLIYSGASADLVLAGAKRS